MLIIEHDVDTHDTRAHYLYRCWLKGSRVFEQNKKDGVTLNPPQSIEIAVSPPDPTGDTYCPAGQPASEYAYSAMLPATLVKRMCVVMGMCGVFSKTQQPCHLAE